MTDDAPIDLFMKYLAKSVVTYNDWFHVYCLTLFIIMPYSILLTESLYIILINNNWMSIHNKMQSDYLWIRHAPIEEGLKVRYTPDNIEIMAITICTPEPPIELKGFKWFIAQWASSTIGSLKSLDSGGRVSIEATKRDWWKTLCDSLSTQLDTWAISSHPLCSQMSQEHCQSWLLFLFLELFGNGRSTQTKLRPTMTFYWVMGRMLKEWVEDTKVIMIKSPWQVQLSSICFSKSQLLQIKL